MTYKEFETYGFMFCYLLGIISILWVVLSVIDNLDGAYHIWNYFRLCEVLQSC